MRRVRARNVPRACHPRARARSLALSCYRSRLLALFRASIHARSLARSFLPAFCFPPSSLFRSLSLLHTRAHARTRTSSTLIHSHPHVLAHPRTRTNTHSHTHTLTGGWKSGSNVHDSRPHCNILYNTHCNTLQHTATHCNTLQHTATHCNTLQHAVTHCNTLQHTGGRKSSANVHDSRVSGDCAQGVCVLRMCCRCVCCSSVCCSVCCILWLPFTLTPPVHAHTQIARNAYLYTSTYTFTHYIHICTCLYSCYVYLHISTYTHAHTYI